MPFKSSRQRKKVMALLKQKGIIVSNDKDAVYWGNILKKKNLSPVRDKSGLREVVSDLNPYEERMYLLQLKANKGNANKALEVVVNSVEGDESQLSPKLKKYAKKKGWLEGYG